MRASLLVATRADTARCWDNAARLQEAHGDTEAATQSRRVAAQVRGVNGWLRARGKPKGWRVW